MGSAMLLKSASIGCCFSIAVWMHVPPARSQQPVPSVPTTKATLRVFVPYEGTVLINGKKPWPQSFVSGWRTFSLTGLNPDLSKAKVVEVAVRLLDGSILQEPQTLLIRAGDLQKADFTISYSTVITKSPSYDLDASGSAFESKDESEPEVVAAGAAEHETGTTPETATEPEAASASEPETASASESETASASEPETASASEPETAARPARASRPLRATSEALPVPSAPSPRATTNSPNNSDTHLDVLELPSEPETAANPFGDD